MIEDKAHITDNNDISPAMQEALLTISKWIRLISTAGFSLGSFVVMVMLLSGKDLLLYITSQIPVKYDHLYVLVVAGFFILFFTTALVLHYLHHASKLLLKAAIENDAGAMKLGFTCLKKFFIILVAVGLLQLITNLSGLF